MCLHAIQQHQQSVQIFYWKSDWFVLLDRTHVTALTTWNMFVMEYCTQTTSENSNAWLMLFWECFHFYTLCYLINERVVVKSNNRTREARVVQSSIAMRTRQSFSNDNPFISCQWTLVPRFVNNSIFCSNITAEHAENSTTTQSHVDR